VTSLDDVQAVRELDPSDMLGAVAGLPADCRVAYEAAVGRDDLPSADRLTSLTVCGMGGSAVAGDVLRSIFRGRLGLPVDVNRSPELPASCGPHTLVVASSCSGNTAETLAAFHEALARGCRLLAITSGGVLEAEATAAGVPVVSVPSGMMPRAALGHLVFSLLGALEAVGLLPRLGDDVHETLDVLQELGTSLGVDVVEPNNLAKRTATWIGDRIPVIWGAEGIGAVAAMRWKTQLNENGKIPAWWASMSELDHNEVVGWTVPYGRQHVVIALRHEGEHPEIGPRFPLSLDIARAAGADAIEVGAAGRSALARLMGLILIGDYTSVYVAFRRDLDPTPVLAIDHLKSALAGGGR
jgi:glucose/mannose-6-phosphate isomerase